MIVDNLEYKIMGMYDLEEPEELDSAETREEAEYLRGEYQLAFGNNWKIYIRKEKSNEQSD